MDFYTPAARSMLKQTNKSLGLNMRRKSQDRQISLNDIESNDSDSDVSGIESVDEAVETVKKVSTSSKSKTSEPGPTKGTKRRSQAERERASYGKDAFSYDTDENEGGEGEEGGMDVTANDDDDDDVPEEGQVWAKRIESIVAVRERNPAGRAKGEGLKVLMKMKNGSYRNLAWAPANIVMRDVRGKPRLRTWLRKFTAYKYNECHIEDLIDLEWTEVERVIGSRIEKYVLPDEDNDGDTGDEEDGVSGEEEDDEDSTLGLGGGVGSSLSDSQRQHGVPKIKEAKEFHCDLCSLQKFDRLVPCGGCNGECKAQAHLQCVRMKVRREQSMTSSSGSSTDDAEETQNDWEHGEDLPSFLCTLCTNGDGPAKKVTDMANQRGVNNEYVEHLLVKWRGLGYTQCTWEFPDQLESSESKVGEFRRWEETFAKLNKAERQSSIRRGSWNSGPRSSWDNRERGGILRSGGKLPASDIPVSKVELREYQVEGVSWLVFQWVQRRSCILADEMGLGKTIQSICFLSTVRKFMDGNMFALVVAPVSTLRHWQRELEHYTSMSSAMLYGTQEDRRRFKELEFEKSNNGSLVPKFHVLLTTYEIATAEVKWLTENCFFEVSIWDEGHRLKNVESKGHTELSLLKTDFKVLLTGTPIQNNTGEIHALLSFVMPNDFKDRENFLQKYENITTDEQVKALQRLLRTYMLRREKRDVELNIPKKTETVVTVEMTLHQKRYYKAVLERNRKFLGRGKSGMKELPQLVSILAELRKVCNHPYICVGAREPIEEDHEAEEKKRRAKAKSEFKPEDVLISCSGKLVFLMKFLPKLIREKGKVLIFSQFTLTLNIIEEFLHKYEYKWLRIDGNTAGTARGRIIRYFNDPKNEINIFLLTTRAGGLGLNLQAANTVIIFDSDWNPQGDIQAMSRSHRLGQKREVKIYRLLTRNTIEAHIFSTANKKLGLTNVLLNGLAGKQGANTKAGKKERQNEVENILKYGAVEFLQEDDAHAREVSSKFMNEDIDVILKNSSKEVVFTDGGYVEAGKEEVGDRTSKSAFAQLTFVTEKESVDMNDENFWEKALPGTMSRIPLLVEHFSTDAKLEKLRKDAELREEVFSRVEKIATAVHLERAEGETPEEMEVVVSLLDLVVSSGQYSEERNSALKDLRDSIVKPKRKRRQVRANTSYAEVDDGNGESGDESYGDADGHGHTRRNVRSRPSTSTADPAVRARVQALAAEHLGQSSMSTTVTGRPGYTAAYQARLVSTVSSLGSIAPPGSGVQKSNVPHGHHLAVQPEQMFQRTYRTLYYCNRPQAGEKDFVRHVGHVWANMLDKMREKWVQLAARVNARSIELGLVLNQQSVIRFNGLLSVAAGAGRVIFEDQDVSDSSYAEYAEWQEEGSPVPVDHFSLWLKKEDVINAAAQAKNRADESEANKNAATDMTTLTEAEANLARTVEVSESMDLILSARSTLTREPRPALKWVRHKDQSLLFFVDMKAILPIPGPMNITAKQDGRFVLISTKVAPHQHLVSWISALENDILLAVNGTTMVDRSIEEVVNALREAQFPKILLVRRIFSTAIQGLQAPYIDSTLFHEQFRVQKQKLEAAMRQQPEAEAGTTASAASTSARSSAS